jgi:CHAD domain-containing protein
MPFDLDRIQKSTRKVRKFLKKNPKGPGAEDIHALRTNSRTLETAFETLGLDQKRAVRHLVSDLSDVRKRAGKVRDMDVFTEHALTVKQNGERACHVKLVEHLATQRQKYAKKLRRDIEKRSSHLRSDIKRNAKRLEKVLRDAAKNPDSNPGASAMARTIQLSVELQKPVRLTKANLHPYRLKVKELRDVLQMSDKAGDPAFLKKLGEVKDAIGEWHDWEELILIATDLLDHGGSCKLLQQFKSTSDSKFEQALFLTKQLRHDYLKSQSETPVPETVILATSAIAEN